MGRELYNGLGEPHRGNHNFEPSGNGIHKVRGDSHAAEKWVHPRGHENNNHDLPRRGTLYSKGDILREVTELSDKDLRSQLEERVSRRHGTSSNWLTQLSEEELRDGPLPFGMHEEVDVERGIEDVGDPDQWEFFQDSTLQ